MNISWMWPFDDPATIRASKLMRGPIGKLLYTRLSFSPRVIVKAAWGDKRTLTAALHRHYTLLHRLADLRPRTLAITYGSSSGGDCAWRFVVKLV